MKIGLWVLLVVSAVATVHLGWHWVVDDIASVAVALSALWIARLLTGFRRSEPQAPARVAHE